MCSGPRSSSPRSELAPPERRGTETQVAQAQQDTDAVFSALAHATRRRILLVLQMRGGELTAGQIAERFACAWPTTTRHLKVLVGAGLVAVTKRGRSASSSSRCSCR